MQILKVIIILKIISSILTRDIKKWKSHYLHFTTSFLDEENIDTETMKKINDEIFDFYFSAHKKDKLFHYSEAHLPKIQTIKDKVTGDLVSRKRHNHLTVSYYDQTTGNQIRKAPFSAGVQKVLS